MVVGVGDGFDETHVSSLQFPSCGIWWSHISFSYKGHLPADKVTGPCFFLLGTDTTWKQFMDLAFLVAFYSDSDWCSAVYVFGLFVMIFSSRTGW
jgi:hypothetical protein